MRAHRQALSGSIALLAVLALGGCGPADGEPEPPAGVDAADPTGLVGLWRVERPTGSDAEWLRLDAPELQLWVGGSLLLGSWAAGGSLLVADVNGWIGDADPDDGAWLDDVTGYRAAPDGWDLVGVDDAVVASLSVDGAPSPIAEVTDDWTRPPELTARMREVLAPPAALPAGLTAPTTADLVGLWVADVPSTEQEPHVELLADGTYSGSDGCNGAAGRWALGGAGRILATSGPMTAIGCEGAPVPTWLASAGRAGLDGDRLVLLDASGTELGRLGRG